MAIHKLDLNDFRNLRIRVKLSLEEIANGVEKKIKVKRCQELI